MWLNLAEVQSLLRTKFVGRRIIYVTSTSSTQDVARQEAEEGAREGTVVIAEEQTAGRGRFGRKWVSPAGLNLYQTILMRPDAARLRALGMITPLAVCLAVESVCEVKTRIKWPNDVQVKGRKLSGILIESESSGSDIRYSLVGPGLNVNFEIVDPEIAGIATSLIQETGREVPREELLAVLLNRFEELYLAWPAGDEVWQAWRDRLDTIGRAVTVRFQGESHEGLAEDVDREGNLLLRLPDGGRMTLEAGEVSLRA